MPDILIEESEDVGLPLSDSRIHGIVPIIRCLAYWWVNLQNVGLVQPSQFTGQGLAGSRGVVVRRVKQHDGNGCLADRSQQEFAYFGRTFPGSCRTAKCDSGSQAAVALRREKGELTPERVSYYRNAVSVDSRQAFQERQACHDIGEMVGRQQDELQALASFISLRILLALQDILHKRPLVRRESLAAPEKIEKGVAVFHEDWRQYFGCFRNRESAAMRCIGAARAMNEQDSRRESGALWPPEKALQA